MGGLNNNLFSFDGEWLPGEIDKKGSLKVSPQAPSASSENSPLSFTDFGANITLNISSVTANVLSFACHNSNPGSRFFQLHNTATVPSVSAVPAETFLIPAGSQVVIGTEYFTNSGVNFSNGVAFAFSTTKNTFTAGLAADQTTKIKFVN